MQRLVAPQTVSTSPQTEFQFGFESELALEEESVAISEAPFGLDHILQHIGYFLEWPFTFVVENECVFVQLKSDAYVLFERRYLHNHHTNIFSVGLFRPDWRVFWNGQIRRRIYHEVLNRSVCRQDGAVVHEFLKARLH